MKFLFKTWSLALLVLILPQIVVAYISTTPNGFWTGTGTTSLAIAKSTLTKAGANL